MKVKRINISLEPWMDEKLMRIAKKCGTNRSGAIRLLIENADEIDKLQKDSYAHQTDYKAPTSHNVHDDNQLEEEIIKIMRLHYPHKFRSYCRKIAKDAIEQIKLGWDIENYVNS